MGKAGAESERKKIGFVMNLIWFLYVAVGLAVLAGVFVSVFIWTVRALT